MEEDGNRNRRCLQPLLHHLRTAALTDATNPFRFENPTNFPSGKEPGVYPTGTFNLSYEHPRSELAGGSPAATLSRRTASVLRSASRASPKLKYPRSEC